MAVSTFTVLDNLHLHLFPRYIITQNKNRPPLCLGISTPPRPQMLPLKFLPELLPAVRVLPGTYEVCLSAEHRGSMEESPAVGQDQGRASCKKPQCPHLCIRHLFRSQVL